MRLLVAILAFAWAFEGAPRLWSANVAAGTIWGGETAPSASFFDAWDDVVFSSERERGAHVQGRSVVHHALGATRSYLALPRDERVLDQAADAAIRQDHLRVQMQIAWHARACSVTSDSRYGTVRRNSFSSTPTGTKCTAFAIPHVWFTG